MSIIDTQPTMAAAGIVITHAQTISEANPHRTAFSRCTDPTPAMAPATTCVVETG